MTVNNLIYKLTKCFSWLYFRHWQRWELLLIVLILLILLLLLIWQQRRVATKSVYINQIRERSSIIGVKLADNKSHLKIKEAKKQAKQKKPKEQLEKLNEQIQQLQCEINKHKNNETHLKNQLTELTAANELLRQNNAEGNQLEQTPRQKFLEVSAVNEKTFHESTERNMPKQPTDGLKAIKKPSKSKIDIQRQRNSHIKEKYKQPKLTKEQKEQPLDIQKLQAIAELAKQIQGRRRR